MKRKWDYFGGSLSDKMDAFRQTPFAERREMAAKIRECHPGRVAVICGRGPTFAESHHGGVPPKVKYLVPEGMTLGVFQCLIRRQFYMGPSDALFFFCQGRLAATVATMARLFEEGRDEDGFLYLTCCGENTFGSL